MLSMLSYRKSANVISKADAQLVLADNSIKWKAKDKQKFVIDTENISVTFLMSNKQWFQRVLSQLGAQPTIKIFYGNFMQR